MSNRGKIFRNSIFLLVMIVSLLSATFLQTFATSYNMKYNLTYTGVPFGGGAIILASNFTNIGQLTIRVTNILFASDFWSNGTRQLTSCLPFNLTAGTSKEVDTPIVVPAGTPTGDHVVTGTASWQYNNSTGWRDASPVATKTTVTVSQTLSSLFASLTPNLIIGLLVVAVVVVSVVAVVVLKKKSKPQVAQMAASA